MATISFLADRNCSHEIGNTRGVTETNNSGASMTRGIELNIDQAKVTSVSDILEALECFKKAVMQSNFLGGA